VPSSSESREARRGHRHRLDRRVVVLLEVAPKPPGGDARVSARILARDQERQLERLAEAESAELLRGRLSDEQVAALKRSPEDGPGVPL
jgi:hypothetical protein